MAGRRIVRHIHHFGLVLCEMNGRGTFDRAIPQIKGQTQTPVGMPKLMATFNMVHQGNQALRSMQGKPGQGRWKRC